MGVCFAALGCGHARGRTRGTLLELQHIFCAYCLGPRNRYILRGSKCGPAGRCAVLQTDCGVAIFCSESLKDSWTKHRYILMNGAVWLLVLYSDPPTVRTQLPGRKSKDSKSHTRYILIDLEFAEWLTMFRIRCIGRSKEGVRSFIGIDSHVNV